MAKNLAFQLQAELQATKYIAHNQQLEIQQLKQQLNQALNEATLLKQEMSQSTVLLEGAAAQVDFLREENKKLSSTISSNDSVCILQTKLNQAQQESLNYQNQIVQLKQQQQKQQQIVQHLQQRFVAQDIENNGLLQQLESLRQNFAILSEQKDAYQGINKQLQQQIFDFQSQQIQDSIQNQTLVGTTMNQNTILTQTQTLRQSQMERELREARQQQQEDQIVARQLKLDNEQLQLKVEHLKQDAFEMKSRAGQEFQRMKLGFQQRFNDASLEYAKLQQEYRRLQEENQHLKHTINTIQLQQTHTHSTVNYDSQIEQQYNQYQESQQSQSFRTPECQEVQQPLRLSPKDLTRQADQHIYEHAKIVNQSIENTLQAVVVQQAPPQVQYNSVTHQEFPMREKCPVVSKEIESMLDTAKIEDEQSETESIEDLFKSKSMLDSLCQYQQKTQCAIQDIDDMEVQLEPAIQEESNINSFQQEIKSDSKNKQNSQLEDEKVSRNSCQQEQKQVQATVVNQKAQIQAIEDKNISQTDEQQYEEENTENSDTENDQQLSELQKAPTKDKLDDIEAKVQSYEKMMKQITVTSDKPEISLGESNNNNFYASQLGQSNKDLSTMSELREKYDPNGIAALSKFHQQEKLAQEEDENMSISDLKMDVQPVEDDLGLDDEFETEIPAEKKSQVEEINQILEEQRKEQLLDADFHDIDSMREFDENDLDQFQSQLGKSGRSNLNDPEVNL